LSDIAVPHSGGRLASVLVTPTVHRMGIIMTVLITTTLVVIGPLGLLSHFVHDHIDPGMVGVAPDGTVAHVENADSPGHDSHHWHFWMVPGDSANGPEVGQSSAATRVMVVDDVWGPTVPPFPPFSPPRA